MPEGDTIHHAARRLRPIVEGAIPEVQTPHPRFGRDRWPERLAGRAVRSVDAHGKHLFLRFEGGLTVHSHLRMTGAWATYASGRRWGAEARPPGAAVRSRRPWLVLRARDGEAIQFDGPVLELMTDGRTRFDQRFAALGPDILAPELDEDEILRRLRADDPTRPIGDALLDQRTVAGIGNLWKCEGCHAAALDPWRPAGTVADDDVRGVLRATRPPMQESAEHGFSARPRAVYGRAGEPCPRCGTRIRRRGQGEDNRVTYWCPACQG